MAASFGEVVKRIWSCFFFMTSHKVTFATWKELQFITKALPPFNFMEILATHFWPGIYSAQNVSAVFVFGDSLVEVGNNYYIDSFAKPGFPNEELGFKNYSHPYLAPNTTGDLILKGVNYASSGSGILNSTGSLFGERICMNEQISDFAKTRQDIISRIGASVAHRFLRKALYLLAVGANDILFRGLSTTRDINNYLDDLVSNFKSQLRRSHLCADNCVSSSNDLAKSYNSRLKSLLQELTTNLSGSTFIYVDYYAITEDILHNYRSYGFENADSACCRVIERRGGLIPCGSLSRVCPDRTKYVFWDPFHPTESANLIAAKHALDGGLKYFSPINIR
ncbi:hypothetical protein CRYUN_Cryun32bG0067700 [Craigia yunnanensis]